MLEILQFIFSSFWVWSGTLILVSVFGYTIAETIEAIRKKK